jgi:uncharacterized protein (DUF58 family)
VPTKRGWAAVGAGLFLWLAARFVGSPDLHMVAAGILVLPLLATLFVRGGQPRIDVRRQLSSTRVSPGTRVTVTLTVENLGRATLSFLLLEDSLPGQFGKAARLVISGIPSRNQQTVSYSMVCRRRGRYVIGPLSVFVSDPFGLARVKVATPDQNELIVYPEVEDLQRWKLASVGVGAGESAVRLLHRSAAEFYTMREYVTGDDLRRIHWPSVAKTGQLMIRQDESTRRSAAVLILDNRSTALAAGAGFERAVSSAASTGLLLIRAGYTLKLATADVAALDVTEPSLLEFLADVGPARTKSMTDAMTMIRRVGRGEATLAMVSALPPATDVAAMTRLGTRFGRKLAILIYPVDPGSLPPEAAAEYEARATAARVSLTRAGWDTFLIRPDTRLGEVWRKRSLPRAWAAASVSS